MQQTQIIKKKKGRKDKEVCGSSVFHERRESVDVGFFLSFGCKKTISMSLSLFTAAEGKITNLPY